MTLTYQTRPTLDGKLKEILSECALIFNNVEHSLYAEVASGKNPASCKKSYLKKYGITARQFNACRVSLEGKIASCQASQDQGTLDLQKKSECTFRKIRKIY